MYTLAELNAINKIIALSIKEYLGLTAIASRTVMDPKGNKPRFITYLTKEQKEKLKDFPVAVDLDIHIASKLKAGDLIKIEGFYDHSHDPEYRTYEALSDIDNFDFYVNVLKESECLAARFSSKFRLHEPNAKVISPRIDFTKF